MRTFSVFFILFFILITNAYSGVIVGGTRVIYNEGGKDSSIDIENPDEIAYLIQSWVDDENGEPQSIFSVTPPLFKLPRESTNTLRIFLTEDVLPNNRESLFWLNIKNIPSVKFQENSLQIAFRTQMKLIYRPISLKNVDFNKEQKKIIWSKSGNKIIVKNPTPYYINFQRISFNEKALKNVSYIAPFSTVEFNTESSSKHGTIKWELINDFGATTKTFDKKI